MSGDCVRPTTKLDTIKPINVLVLDEKDSDVFRLFESILDCKKYTIYHTSLEEHFKPSVNETALIVSQKPLSKLGNDSAARVLNFFRSGGSVICPISKPSMEMLNKIRGICCQVGPKYLKLWIRQSSAWISFHESFGRPDANLVQRILPHLSYKSTSSSQCGTLKLSPATVFPEHPTHRSGSIVKQSRLTLDFDPAPDAGASEDYLPIFSHASDSIFNWSEFSSRLRTRLLGRTLIHVAVVGSTFDLLEGPKPLANGLAVISDYQLSGRGRGNNRWLSPKGCAMGSFQLTVPVRSVAGQHASLIQFATALAVVQAVEELTNHRLILSLKWPNDIYYGANTKMGGILVLTSVMRDQMTLNIGLGFNLANSDPTVCLNDLLTERGCELLSRENFFACTLNHLEDHLDHLEAPSGLEALLELYHKYWLHSEQAVQLLTTDGSSPECSGVVKRIDEYGYLIVCLQDGQMRTVHPGDNSFDMMQGLILPKDSKSL